MVSRWRAAKVSYSEAYCRISGTKESSYISGNNDDIQLRTSDIYSKLGITINDMSVYNGDMLSFKDKETVIQVMDALDELRSDHKKCR